MSYSGRVRVQSHAGKVLAASRSIYSYLLLPCFGTHSCFATRKPLKVIYKQVLATSRSPYEAAAARAGVALYRDANDFCEEHPDVVVLATSILSTEAVLAGLPVQRLRRNTLFVDVLSVKLFPKRLMLALLPPEACPAPCP